VIITNEINELWWMVSWEGYGRKAEITPISNLLLYMYEIKLFQFMFLGYYTIQSHGFISTFRRQISPLCSEWLGCGAYWKDGRGMCSIIQARWQGLCTLRATKSFGGLHLLLRSLPFLWFWLAAIAAKGPIKSTISYSHHYLIISTWRRRQHVLPKHCKTL
jgi:hypothetical protein